MEYKQAVWIPRSYGSSLGYVVTVVDGVWGMAERDVRRKDAASRYPSSEWIFRADSYGMGRHESVIAAAHDQVECPFCAPDEACAYHVAV